MLVASSKDYAQRSREVAAPPIGRGFLFSTNNQGGRKIKRYGTLHQIGRLLDRHAMHSRRTRSGHTRRVFVDPGCSTLPSPSTVLIARSAMRQKNEDQCQFARMADPVGRSVAGRAGSVIGRCCAPKPPAAFETPAFAAQPPLSSPVCDTDLPNRSELGLQAVLPFQYSAG